MLLEFSYVSAEAREVPSSLLALIPVGANSIQLTGKTPSGESCFVNLESSSLAFSAVAFQKDSDDQIIPSTLAKFQIGLGHKLESIDDLDSELSAVSYTKAQEEYSQDRRSFLTIKRDNHRMTNVIIKEKVKLAWVWVSSINLECNFD